MTTIELSNITNFIINTKKNKTFLISSLFKNKKENTFKNENQISDDSEREKSYIFLGIKEDFDLNKLSLAFKTIISNNQRSYQIDASSFVTKKVKINDVIKEFIHVWYEFHGKQFSLKTKKEKLKPTYFLIDEFDIEKWFDEILMAEQLCEIRYLQNMPPNILTINKFTSYAKTLCSNNKKLELNILEKKDLEKLKMNLILGVNSGSKEKVKVIVVEYKGKKSSKNKITFVGKGIIFDSGGYNLKTGRYMLDMKFDMSGAAIALLLVDTLSKLKINQNISCVIPVTDNMVDSLGQLPESIWTSMSGKTVEVDNTDAEGRLILADAITYAAKKLNSSLIIDLATLTGTVIYALGRYTGIWSTSDSYWKQIENSAKRQRELVWRMPLDNLYLDSLYKNTSADILSCSNVDKPDSNIAAAWLNLFADKRDYIHVDIAGTAEENHKAKSPMFKTLIDFVKSQG